METQHWSTNTFLNLAFRLQNYALIYSVKHMGYEQNSPWLALTFIPSELPQ